MRYLNLVVIILFIILNLLSCDNNKSNIYNSYYDNGNLKRIIKLYKDDRIKIKTYHESGIMSGEFKSRNGILDGVQFKYDEEGKIKEKIICMRGLKYFEIIKYYNNGNIMSHNTYLYGNLHGEQLWYNNEGQLIKKKIYYDGILDN